MACDHTSLIREPSLHSTQVGYSKRTQQQLRSAAGVGVENFSDILADYAAPLILPNDDLALDPKYPPQSLRTWKREKERNAVVAERQTIYVATSPQITSEVALMSKWSSMVASPNDSLVTPDAGRVVNYLGAFYHGLPVKILPESEQPLSFVSWEKPKRSRKVSEKIPELALATATEAVQIRHRPCPDGLFPRQLSLNDLLDVVIDILPQDAYCLLLLVDQDLYEDEDDDFCCGRAYGGSRCAVVSTARYNPEVLRSVLGSDDLHHPWPLSHCTAYVEKVGGGVNMVGQSTEGHQNFEASLSASDPTFPGAIGRAFVTFKPGTRGDDASDWLFNVCKTASHEIGHCFAMDHCVYFACIMQGTASMAEDRRQPPDLCPIDLEKMKQAVGESLEGHENWKVERYETLLRICEEYTGQSGDCWSAYQAWLQARLARSL